MNLGIGYLPENRKTEGLILNLEIMKNISLCSLDKITPVGWLSSREEQRLAKDYVENLKISPPDIHRQVLYLSGGNQQKVVLAKWLSTEAKVLIFDEPTRGVDVNAKVEIYQMMNKLVKAGLAVITISSETAELLGMADRIVVMHEGKVVAERIPCNTCEEELLSDYFWTREA